MSFFKTIFRTWYPKYRELTYRLFRHYKTHKTYDYFIISFPKSGRTWLRTILAKYFSLVYNTPFTTELNKIKHDNIPRIAFSHYIHALKYHKDKKAVILIRDPRDVIVSHYHQLSKRNVKFKGTISQFIRHRTFGITHLINYMNALKKFSTYPSHVHWITYENLHKHTEQEIHALLSFLNIEINKEKIREAIQFSNFENMQKMEQQGKFKSERLRPTDPTNINTYKVRKGKIGNYKNELSQEDIDYINQEIKKNLHYKEYT